MNPYLKEFALTVLAIFLMLLSAQLLYKVLHLYSSRDEALLALVVCLLAIKMARKTLRRSENNERKER